MGGRWWEHGREMLCSTLAPWLGDVGYAITCGWTPSRPRLDQGQHGQNFRLFLSLLFLSGISEHRQNNVLSLRSSPYPSYGPLKYVLLSLSQMKGPGLLWGPNIVPTLPFWRLRRLCCITDHIKRSRRV